MAPDILSKWDKISPNLELKSEQQVSDMVRRFFDNYIKVKGKCANYKTRLKYLAPKLKTVMDVTKCTCKLQFRVDCDEKTCQTNAALVKMTNRGEESTAHQHVKCLCFKLLPDDCDYLYSILKASGPSDIYYPGRVDKATTVKLNKSRDRAEKKQANLSKKMERENYDMDNTFVNPDDILGPEDDHVDGVGKAYRVDGGKVVDGEYIPDFNDITTQRNYEQYPRTCTEADRYYVSSRVVAAILNAFMVDVGLLEQVEDCQRVVHHLKIQRQRQGRVYILHKIKNSPPPPTKPI